MCSQKIALKLRNKNYLSQSGPTVLVCWHDLRLSPLHRAEAGCAPSAHFWHSSSFHQLACALEFAKSFSRDQFLGWICLSSACSPSASLQALVLLMTTCTIAAPDHIEQTCTRSTASWSGAITCYVLYDAICDARLMRSTALRNGMAQARNHTTGSFLFAK